MTKSPCILVFESDAFDFGDREINSDPPIGKDAIEHFADRLREFNVEILGEPVSGEGGWTIDAKLNDDGYHLFLHWVPIGDPPRDCWSIQPDISKSLLRSLFGKPANDRELHPIVECLKLAISDDDQLTEVRWLTREEFNNVY